MKAKQLADTAKHIATQTKTIYVYGTYGRSLTESMIAYKAKQYPRFNTPTRTRKYRSLLGKGYYAWDCCGLIKGILWGWDGKTEVGYAKNGVPDVGANTMIQMCSGVSTSFSNMQIGEVVWMNGHIGIYIGAGQVVEATPRWKDGVQITTLKGRGWTKRGKLPWVNYSADVPVLDGYFCHTVVKGDTPWDLAVKYLGDGNRYKEIMRLNNLPDSATIYVGQKLDIPSDGEIIHTVAKGDTPWQLAAEYLGDGSKYKKIMRANGLKDDATIYVGQELRIPSDGAIVHVVRSGDTPWGLAVRYLGDGKRYKEIMKLNGLAENATIYVNDEIKIPAR